MISDNCPQLSGRLGIFAFSLIALSALSFAQQTHSGRVDSSNSSGTAQSNTVATQLSTSPPPPPPTTTPAPPAFTGNCCPCPQDAPLPPEGDCDCDGLTNAQESTLGSNPRHCDSDGDTISDGEDAHPLDPAIRWQRTSEPTYALVRIPLPENVYPPDFTFLSVNNHGNILAMHKKECFDFSGSWDDRLITYNLTQSCPCDSYPISLERRFDRYCIYDLWVWHENRWQKLNFRLPTPGNYWEFNQKVYRLDPEECREECWKISRCNSDEIDRLVSVHKAIITNENKVIISGAALDTHSPDLLTHFIASWDNLTQDPKFVGDKPNIQIRYYVILPPVRWASLASSISVPFNLYAEKSGVINYSLAQYRGTGNLLAEFQPYRNFSNTTITLPGNQKLDTTRETTWHYFDSDQTYMHFVRHKNHNTYVAGITNAGDVLVWWDANNYSATPEPYRFNANEHWSVDNTSYRLYRSDGGMENLGFIPKHDYRWNPGPQIAMTQSPRSDVIVTYFDSGRLESKVSINGQWLETCSPLPARLNARGEGLISHTSYFGMDYFWLPNPEVHPYNKPTALWRNGKVLTIPDLLGSEVDPVQVGALWDINDHGLIAANSPTHGPALLVPVELVELSPRVLDEDGNEIEGSERPLVFPKLNEMVEEIEIKNEIEQNRIAHREMKLRIPGGAFLNGKKVTWTMKAWGVKEFDDVRGDWRHSKVEESRNRFEESKNYGGFGYKLISQESSETTIEPEGYDGFTAIRANLPPIGWNHAEIKIKVERSEEEIPLARFIVPAVIVIDPGHGGETDIHGSKGSSSHNNAVGGWWRVQKTKNGKSRWVDEKVYDGASGVLEKTLTLEYALSLRDLLRLKRNEDNLSLRIYLTRDDDRNLGGYERAKVARDKGADTFLSIHFNSTTSNKTARGTLMVIRKNQNANFKEDQTFANRFPARVAAALHKHDATAKKTPSYPVEKGTSFTSDILGFYQDAQYHPIRSAVVEVEFIHSKGGDKLINGNATKELVKQSVAEALRDSLIEELYDFKTQND